MSEAAAAANPEQQTEIVEGGTTVEIPPDPPAPRPAGGEQDGEPRKSRAERRAERGADYAAEAREARRIADEERQARHALELKVAALEGRVSANPGPDPNQAALDDIARRIENAVARMGQGDDSARAEWHQLRREEAKIIGRMQAEETSRAVEERITKAIPKPADPRMAALQAEFPLDDPEFRAVAEGEVAKIVRRERRDMNNPQIRFATLREGAALAARELGIGGHERKAPTEVERGRVAGTGSGDSGAGGGGKTVHLTSQQMKMAEQLFRNLQPAEAHVKWWKEIGSKIPAK